jgi:hypothetical protein
MEDWEKKISKSMRLSEWRSRSTSGLLPAMEAASAEPCCGQGNIKHLASALVATLFVFLRIGYVVLASWTRPARETRERATRPTPLAAERAGPDRPYQAAVLTSTFLAFAGTGLGTVTLSTPLAMLALIASGSTPSGSSMVRAKAP